MGLNELSHDLVPAPEVEIPPAHKRSVLATVVVILFVLIDVTVFTAFEFDPSVTAGLEHPDHSDMCCRQIVLPFRVTVVSVPSAIL